MSWELAKALFETAASIAFYAILFGAGVTGLTFVTAFTCWLIDRIRKEWES